MSTATLNDSRLRIGPLTLDVPVVLAPMAGITNTAFRRLCREYGAGLYVSEMITTRALVVQAPTAAPAGWYEIGDGRQQWWDGQNWTGQIKADVHRALPPPGWYDDGAGSRRWWDGREWTAHTQGSLGATPQSLMVESVDA